MIKESKQTGKLMFKFDNDEPQELAIIYDYGKVIIELQQLGKGAETKLIEFTSKKGKKFTLFIEHLDN